MVHHRIFLSTTVCLLALLSFKAFANPKKPQTEATPTSARITAEAEIYSPPTSATKPQHPQAVTGSLSAEQTATMLQLEDPFEAPQTRDFSWNLGVFLSAQKPQGMVEVSGVGTQNLNDLKSSYSPSLSLGALYALAEGSAGAFQVGGEIEANYSTQKASLTTTSGSQIDGTVNSSIFDARLLVRWGSRWISKAHGRAGLGIGKYTLTQTSDNSLARWSRDGGLVTYLLGIDYQLSKRWYAQLNYRDFANRGAFPEGLRVPGSFVEAGAQVIW